MPHNVSPDAHEDGVAEHIFILLLVRQLAVVGQHAISDSELEQTFSLLPQTIEQVLVAGSTHVVPLLQHARPQLLAGFEQEPNALNVHRSAPGVELPQLILLLQHFAPQPINCRDVVNGGLPPLKPFVKGSQPMGQDGNPLAGATGVEHIPLTGSTQFEPVGQHFGPQYWLAGLQAVHIPLVESLQSCPVGQHTGPHVVPLHAGGLHVLVALLHVNVLGQQVWLHALSGELHTAAGATQAPALHV